MTVKLPKDAAGREIPLDTKVLYGEDGKEFEVNYYEYSVHQTIPRRKWRVVMMNCEGYFDDNGFDFEKFDTWLSIVPFMVVVSEYTAPRDCVEVARKEKRVNMAANGKASNRIERLFVHQNFADEYRKRMGRVDVEDES